MRTRKSLPHARGGVSGKTARFRVEGESSPRAWGCFRDPERLHFGDRVFPTRVGVFLRRGLSFHAFCSLPHARGGVSDHGQKDRTPSRSSPRTWGGAAHVLLVASCAKSLPHARGGGSSTTLPTTSKRSSPQAESADSPPCSTSPVHVDLAKATAQRPHLSFSSDVFAASRSFPLTSLSLLFSPYFQSPSSCCPCHKSFPLRHLRPDRGLAPTDDSV